MRYCHRKDGIESSILAHVPRGQQGPLQVLITEVLITEVQVNVLLLLELGGEAGGCYRQVVCHSGLIRQVALCMLLNVH